VLKIRLIAVLILRDGHVVQSVRFKHTNAIHYDPIHAMECFNKWAIDEIVMLNVSRDAASRDAFADAVSAVSSSCFVPLAAGGWVTDDAFAAKLLLSGADKLVLNTALADDADLVTRLSRRYGAQCIVASMDVKRELATEAHRDPVRICSVGPDPQASGHVWLAFQCGRTIVLHCAEVERDPTAEPK